MNVGAPCTGFDFRIAPLVSALMDPSVRTPVALIAWTQDARTVSLAYADAAIWKERSAPMLRRRAAAVHSKLR